LETSLPKKKTVQFDLMLSWKDQVQDFLNLPVSESHFWFGTAKLDSIFLNTSGHQS
jgi:hypothetical protein